MVEKTLQSTTFRDEIHFMQQLNYYSCVKHALRPKTLFCTIKITNFYTLDTHKNMIYFVECFLKTYILSSKIENFAINDILNLLHLFLDNNIFCYKDKIYEFIKGSPNTIPFSETLSNIYLSIWEKLITDQLSLKKDLYGRYEI